MCNMIFSILSPLLASLTYTTIINNLLYKKLEKKLMFIGFLVTFLTAFILTITNHELLSIPVITILIIIYLYIFTKKIYVTIIVAIFSNFIFAVSDAIVGFFIFNLSSLKYTDLKNNNVYLIVAILILIVSFLISKLSDYIINKAYGNNYSLNEYFKNNIPTMLYIFLGVIALYANVLMQKKYYNNISKFIIFLNLLITVGFLFMSVILVYLSNKGIKDKLNQKYKDKEYRQLKEYTDMIEVMSTDLRGFKHDYMNILQVLGSYIKDDDIKGLKEFYNNDLLPESNKILEGNKNLSVLQHIKISALKGLISSKAITAESRGIEVTIEITDDLFTLAINTLDICRIIGILLDNAMEAAFICKEKIITFALVKNSESTVLIISNSCAEDTPPIHKMYEKDFSTKGEGRGLGLKTVREIINEKYANIIINTKMKDCKFTQELVIFDDKKDK